VVVAVVVPGSLIELDTTSFSAQPAKVFREPTSTTRSRSFTAGPSSFVTFCNKKPLGGALPFYGRARQWER